MPAAAACDVVALVATPTSSEPASCESDVGSADDSEDATPDAAPDRGVTIPFTGRDSDGAVRSPAAASGDDDAPGHGVGSGEGGGNGITGSDSVSTSSASVPLSAAMVAIAATTTTTSTTTTTVTDVTPASTTGWWHWQCRLGACTASGTA